MYLSHAESEKKLVLDILRPQKKISAEKKKCEGLKKKPHNDIQQELHPKNFSSEAMPVRAKPQSPFQNIQGINLIIVLFSLPHFRHVGQYSLLKYDIGQLLKFLTE